MAPQVAWIGLGNMGRGMCKNMVEKGNLEKPLIISNRTQQRATDLSAKLPAGKTTVAEISDAVTRSDIIFTCVGDDAAISETIEKAIGANGGVAGKLFVDCSTVHPGTTEALARRITGAGAAFAACPVFGAPAMADAGQLVCVLAGPPEAVERARPYTKGVIGRAVIDLSGRPGYGAASMLKVIGNSFIFNMIETLAEGHVAAEKSGLGGDSLHQFVEAVFPGVYAAYSTRMMSGDYYKREEPLFAVDLARKDARHALGLCKSWDCQMKALEVSDAHLAGVKEHMGTRGDVCGIYGAVRQEGGLKFEN